MVTDLRLGDKDGGGARHRSASSVAQQAGGSYVIKASQDSCGCPKVPAPKEAAAFDVFCPGTNQSEKVPIREDLSTLVVHCEDEEPIEDKGAAEDEEPDEPVKVNLKLTDANGSLPAHVTEEVRDAVLDAATQLAIIGSGEDKKCHGFTIIVGDSAELLSRDDKDDNCVYGEPSQDLFNYAARGQAKDIRTGPGFMQLQAAAMQDGAIIVDGRTCMLTAANFMVTNIGKGDRDGGGARHRSASAVSQQAGGCYVVKASEDACGCTTTPPVPGAKFDVFCNEKLPRKVAVRPKRKGSLLEERADLEQKLSEVTKEIDLQEGEKPANQSA
mmetsp:Transcript_14560/g.33721  ORF Transcript_14560/g.33721 Transcript_14560/m.33721 type:complete len:328 (-) Transcript_14560:115-1098(-)